MLLHDTVNWYVCIVWMNQYTALVERHWQRKTKALNEKPIQMLLCQPQVPQRMGHVSLVWGQQPTACPQNSRLSTSVRNSMKAILCLQKTGAASVWLPKSIQKLAWACFVPCQSCNHFADITTIQTTGIFRTARLQKPRKYRKTKVSMDGLFAKIKMGKKS
jgi:uncharacterized protein YlaI